MPDSELADLAAGSPDTCTATCWDERVVLYVPIVNRGLSEAGASHVRFRDDDGTTVLEAEIDAVPSGTGIMLGPIEVTQADWGDGSLHVVVDSLDEVGECREGNNELELGPYPCELE